MASLREKIAGRLSEKHETLKSMAANVGVSEYGLQKMIDRGTFKSDTMIRIAKFLDVDMTFFGDLKKQDTDNVKQVKDREDFAKEIDALRQVIATKDEVIRAKDELIATLREKLHK